VRVTANRASDTGDAEADDGTAGALLRAVERFAALMAEAGLPRMAARVYGYLIIGPADGLTAPELAAGLRVSPAAISGAVRTLVQMKLLVREREPGARSDTYRLHGDLWYETYLQRLDQLERWDQVLVEAMRVLGPDHVGASLRETHAFFTFLQEEFPAMLERWHERKDALVADTMPPPP
jgi:DNA-binding transcriptional regulator GbsR (MarR family)